MHADTSAVNTYLQQSLGSAQGAGWVPGTALGVGDSSRWVLRTVGGGSWGQAGWVPGTALGVGYSPGWVLHTAVDARDSRGWVLGQPWVLGTALGDRDSPGWVLGTAAGAELSLGCRVGAGRSLGRSLEQPVAVAGPRPWEPFKHSWGRAQGQPSAQEPHGAASQHLGGAQPRPAMALAS